MNCNYKSNINLKSNLITNDKWSFDKERYLPYDLLPAQYHDSGLEYKLTPLQKERKREGLYRCEKKREVKERIWETDKCYENCKDCIYHSICY